MPLVNKTWVVRGCLYVVLALAAACSPRRIPPMTVTDLMEDRVTLDGVLMKCNQDPARARAEVDCLNARIAIERLANRRDPVEDARRIAEFEKSREQLRVSQDKLRQEQEAKTKVDVYHLPLVPVETPGGGTPPPAVIGKTN